MPTSEYKCDKTIKADQQQKFVLYLSLKAFAKSRVNFCLYIRIKSTLCMISLKMHFLCIFLCTFGTCVKRFQNSISKK